MEQNLSQHQFMVSEYITIEQPLKMHRDRPHTHIISVIINVDQEVNQPWPLVLEDNFYRQHHVLLKPGDMLFYEGARLIHGQTNPAGWQKLR